MRELADGGLGLGEPRQDGSPCRVGQGREGRVERCHMLIVNHSVNLYARSGNVVKALFEGLLRLARVASVRLGMRNQATCYACFQAAGHPAKNPVSPGETLGLGKTSLCPTRLS